MTDKELIQKSPDLLELTSEVLKNKFKSIFHYDLEIHKTWSDNGLDELDCIEFVMYLERELSINIDDEVMNFLFSQKSIPNRVISLGREFKINKILDERN